jgi:hypothetical protein
VTTFGDVIGAGDFVHALIAERVASDLHRLAGRHRQFALYVQPFHQQCTDQEHGDAAMRQSHAQHFSGKAAALGLKACPQEP